MHAPQQLQDDLAYERQLRQRFITLLCCLRKSKEAPEPPADVLKCIFAMLIPDPIPAAPDTFYMIGEPIRVIGESVEHRTHNGSCTIMKPNRTTIPAKEVLAAIPLDRQLRFFHNQAEATQAAREKYIHGLLHDTMHYGRPYVPRVYETPAIYPVTVAKEKRCYNKQRQRFFVQTRQDITTVDIANTTLPCNRDEPPVIKQSFCTIL